MSRGAGTDPKIWFKSEYADIVFKSCRGLKFVDDLVMPEKYKLTEEQWSAADFLQIVARVPLNSIQDIDMSS